MFREDIIKVLHRSLHLLNAFLGSTAFHLDDHERVILAS
jgi:hypothetical protein